MFKLGLIILCIPYNFLKVLFMQYDYLLHNITVGKRQPQTETMDTHLINTIVNKKSKFRNCSLVHHGIPVPRWAAILIPHQVATSASRDVIDWRHQPHPANRAPSRELSLRHLDVAEEITNRLAAGLQAALQQVAPELLQTSAVDHVGPHAGGDVPHVLEGDHGELTTPAHGHGDAAADGEDLVA